MHTEHFLQAIWLLKGQFWVTDEEAFHSSDVNQSLCLN